ncbi:MAG: glycosyltransferase family 4 protein [Pseudomonadota bacterium]
MLRPMFVTDSLKHGGAERHSITVMNRIADRGHECHAVYIKNDQDLLDRIEPRARTTVRCMNAVRFFDTRAIGDFAAHIFRIHPSVIVAANGYALMNASLARIRSGLKIPVIATFHTTRVLEAKNHVKGLFDRPFFWGAERTIFVCKMQKKYWLRRGLGSRINEVIYNGVDTAHFCDKSTADDRLELRQSYGISETDYVIGISAVLRPEKNHLQLVEAIAALRKSGIPARALLIGDGEMRQAIEAKARELKVEGDIIITGLQQDVRPYMAICDVLVLCSLSETFSLAALEAMAMGKAVIHSDVGGAAEMIIPGNNGFLFPVGDTEVFVRRLTTLAEPRVAKRMGSSARAMVETDFSEKSMVDRYEETLFDVCTAPLSIVRRIAR